MYPPQASITPKKSERKVSDKRYFRVEDVETFADVYNLEDTRQVIAYIKCTKSLVKVLLLTRLRLGGNFYLAKPYSDLLQHNCVFIYIFTLATFTFRKIAYGLRLAYLVKSFGVRVLFTCEQVSCKLIRMFVGVLEYLN